MNKTTLESLEEALERLEQIDGVYSWVHLLYEVREALAEQDKQEPVGEVDLHKELGQLRWMGGDEGWDNAIHAVRKRLEELYATPASVEAIRAVALEEAAKEAWNLAPTDESAGEIAAAIRGMK